MRVSFFESTQSGFQWVADRVWKVEHAFERANAANQKVASTRMRIFAILVGLSFAYVILMVFAGRASLSGSPGQIAALTGEPNARAQLVDRNGQLLATDVNDYSLFVDPSDMTAGDRALVKQALIQLFPAVPRETVDKVFAGDSRLLVNNLKAADRERILNYGLPGVTFEAHR
ncbi:MAG: penicillin-binding protein 2, partial [Asticcacaulis sp.]|nr:penicillin-binding protein 2 [Asticcacaulis sp.]